MRFLRRLQLNHRPEIKTIHLVYCSSLIAYCIADLWLTSYKEAKDSRVRARLELYRIEL